MDKPTQPRAASDFVLGRAKARAQFEQGKPFRLSAYWSRAVCRMRYTDPLMSPGNCPSRIRWGKASAVRYIIRVTPK